MLFLPISCLEMQEMARQVLSIYLTLGGNMSTLPKKTNILHMFAEFTNSTRYHDEFYHQIDGILDHLFIMAPDVSYIYYICVIDGNGSFSGNSFNFFAICSQCFTQQTYFHQD